MGREEQMIDTGKYTFRKAAWEKFKWLVWELVKTLSNEKSFFASKRLERFTAFSLAMIIIFGYVRRKWELLTVEETLMIAAFLVGYGAWNAVQSRRDVKQLGLHKESNEK